MLNNNINKSSYSWLWFAVRHYSRFRPPKPVSVDSVIRVSNNVARLGSRKEGPKPRQLLSLPPFPGHPLPGRNSNESFQGGQENDQYVTAVNWIKYYFKSIWGSVIESPFRMVLNRYGDQKKEEPRKPLRKIRPNEVMKLGARIHIPVSIAEARISKRYDAIPSGTLYPNPDEIKYLERLVIYKDLAIIVLNKPPKLPVKGNLPVHNSMDALAAAALSYDYDEGPKLAAMVGTGAPGSVDPNLGTNPTETLKYLLDDAAPFPFAYSSLSLSSNLPPKTLTAPPHIRLPPPSTSLPDAAADNRENDVVLRGRRPCLSLPLTRETEPLLVEEEQVPPAPFPPTTTVVAIGAALQPESTSPSNVPCSHHSLGLQEGERNSKTELRSHHYRWGFLTSKAS
ncbi:hypothetical protein PIB30_011841 [Stylosanthes scabra]|uniref:Uncharacterized protein n=1 Tax=Stylosanthes scabra TaxID=79078 RepID=A0ABU6T7Y3_9FABA|nr:hypothetical protein [Stylosanthes scabra]